MPKIDIYITERFPFYAFDEPEEEDEMLPLGEVFEVSEETMNRLREGMREFDYLQEVLRKLVRGV